LKAHYVTRCYLTRHGAGPLRDELPGHPFGWSDPETNVCGPWQGEFRYAPLSAQSMRDAIYANLAAFAMADDSLRVDPHLVVTCLDQMGTGRQDAWCAALGENVSCR
jgi:adenylosuccinate synthase